MQLGPISLPKDGEMGPENFSPHLDKNRFIPHNGSLSITGGEE